MVALLLLLACAQDAPPVKGDPEPADTDDTDVPEPVDTDTAPPEDTDPTTDTDVTTPVLDCSLVVPGPIVPVPLDDLWPAEDFAFDDAGNLISHHGKFFWKQPYPPAEGAAWAPTQGYTSGVASVRMLETGDVVYHDVDFGSLFRIAPDGGTTLVYSGFGYAGGIEVHPSTGWIYVVDIIGLHRIEPYTQEQDLYPLGDKLFSANGASLSADWTTLYVSAGDGIWALPVDADGVPTAAPVLWAAAPAGASDMLGIAVDACDNVYLANKAFRDGKTWAQVHRYPAGGGVPELIFEEKNGWFSNLQFGSGVGGWGSTKLYVVNQVGGSHPFYELEVGVGEKPR